METVSTTGAVGLRGMGISDATAILARAADCNGNAFPDDYPVWRFGGAIDRLVAFEDGSDGGGQRLDGRR